MSYDDNHSIERPCPFQPCDGHVPTDNCSMSPSTPPPVATASIALLTAAETLLIVGGYGWWVLPVATIVAMFCAMFLCIAWVTGRDILRMMVETTVSAAPRARPRRAAAPLVLVDEPPPERPRPTTTDGPPMDD